jgi:hypothetical protein
MRSSLLIFVSALLLNSCITYTKCVDKFGTLAKDSIATRVVFVVDTTLRVVAPADSLDGGIPLDSLCDQWWNYTTALNDSLTLVNDSLVTISKSGTLSTTHWIDKYNRLLRFKSKKEIDTLYITLRDTVYKDVNCPPVVSFDKSKGSRLWALWEGYQFFAAWALLVLLFVLIFLKKIKRLFSTSNAD